MATIRRNPADALMKGLRWMRWGLLCYAGSSTIFALSTAVYSAAADAARRGDPLNGPLGVAGSLLVLVGIPFLGASPLLLLGSSRFLRLGSPAASSRFENSIWWSGFAIHIGFLIAIAAIPVLFFSGWSLAASRSLAPLGYGMSAASAIVFLVGIMMIPLALGGTRTRLVTSFAGALGSAAQIGEASLSVSLIDGARVNPTWLTLGGYPLVNWNLPLGLSVAVASLMLFWAYRSVEAVATQAKPASG